VILNAKLFWVTGDREVFMRSLKRAEEVRLRYDSIVESSDDAIIARNLEGVISAWNTGAQRMFGYTEAEAIGQPITIIVPPAWRDEEKDILRRVRAGERIEHYETRRVSKDGKKIDVSITMSPVRDVEGRIIGDSKIVRDITERKRAEAVLRESEERFRLAAQAGKMFAYEWDVATDLVVRSGESVQILGIGESTPTTAQELMASVHPADRERVTAAIAELSPERSYLQISYRRVRPDGAVIWVDRSGRAHFDEQGRMVRMVGMTADITERKLAERELALANERLRLAMESGKSVGWDRDVKSGRDSLFGDLQSVFGIHAEVYDGRVDDFHRYLHPEDRRRVVEAIDYAMQAHKPYAAEFRLRWPDGTVRWLAAKGKFYYSRDDEPERMLGMAIDISDRKVAEEALRESEERYRLAIQAGRMYAFDWDVVTDVIIRSEESTHIFGLTAEPIKLTKRELLARVHPEDRATFTNSIVECTPESPNTQISYRLLRPDGSVLWLERTGHAFFDEQGKMMRMIGMVADITERKQAEEALSREAAG
jgi:PAS domain S-box-containing protein